MFELVGCGIGIKLPDAADVQGSLLLVITVIGGTVSSGVQGSSFFEAPKKILISSPVSTQLSVHPC